MWLQYLIIALLFAGAAFYVGRIFWRAFDKRQSGCAKGCGSACSGFDVDQMQRTIDRAQQRQKAAG
ncbi:FeoB-associated Cys-rich membrane protein [Hymenobacter sp. ISL-91]|uniref:FeoB-associated Cys-rich membrane protein n=1 Tax=Hymenobacter sp. ISL-91 TaxID=2819151 RepID=UPI001BE81AC1|nr:FeoB-associated Cys-rich membrane protein [Hymenobacter sp. ISL-91]MBT2556468.1 FeoB-associated Cys-rich membrane protein [Hymenobacter sp. ISL-91]